MKKFFSRKFLFALVILVASTVALFLGKIGGTEWVAAISFVGTSYFFANAYQAKGSLVTVVDGDEKVNRVGFDLEDYRQNEGQSDE